MGAYAEGPCCQPGHKVAHTAIGLCSRIRVLSLVTQSLTHLAGSSACPPHCRLSTLSQYASSARTCFIVALSMRLHLDNAPKSTCCKAELRTTPLQRTLR